MHIEKARADFIMAPLSPELHGTLRSIGKLLKYCSGIGSDVRLWDDACQNWTR
jgi:hypothetical protein